MLRTNTIKNKAGSLLFFLGLIIFWQLAAWAGASFGWWKPYAFPAPAGVLKSLGGLMEDGILLRAVGASLSRVLRGFAIALLAGGGLGLVITFSPYFYRNLKPVLMGIQSLPSVCWVPFAILWFGLKEEAVIFVVVMGCMFGIALSLEDAIKTIPNIYLKAAKTMGADFKSMLTKVMIPAALPSIVAGLKQSWSFAWRALMSGEVMTAYVGLGYTLMAGRDMADINQVMAVMIIIVIIGILIDKLIFENIEQRLLRKRGLSVKR